MHTPSEAIQVHYIIKTKCKLFNNTYAHNNNDMHWRITVSEIASVVIVFVVVYVGY